MIRKDAWLSDIPEYDSSGFISCVLFLPMIKLPPLKSMGRRPAQDFHIPVDVLSKLAMELDTVGRQFEPYRWRPCSVTWDFGPEQSW